MVNNKTDPRERPVNGHCTLYGFSARVNAMNENNFFFSSDTRFDQWRNSFCNQNYNLRLEKVILEISVISPKFHIRI